MTQSRHSHESRLYLSEESIARFQNYSSFDWTSASQWSGCFAEVRSLCVRHKKRMAADGACGQTLHRGSYLPESAVKMISAIAPWVKPNGRKELCKRLTGVNHSGLVATMYRTCGINKWMTGYGKELLPDIPIEWHTHTHTVGLLQRRSVIVLLSTAQLAKWGKAMLPSGAIGHIAVTGNTAVWLDVLKKTVMTRAGKRICSIYLHCHFNWILSHLTVLYSLR